MGRLLPKMDNPSTFALDHLDGLSIEQKRVAFCSDLYASLRKLQDCLIEVSEFLSDELKGSNDTLKNVQQSCHNIEELVTLCKTRKAESTQRVKSGRKIPTRVFYNSCRKRSSDGLRKQCSWCGRSGHLEDYCWMKKGWCSLCGSASHKKETCPSYVMKRHASPAVAPKCLTCKVYHCSQNCSSISSSSSTTNFSASSDTVVFPPVGVDGEVAQSSDNLLQLYSKATYKLSGEKSSCPESLDLSSFMENQHSAELREQVLNDSVCFATCKDEAPNYVLEDSVVFKSPFKPFKNNYYKICSIQEGKLDNDERDAAEAEVLDDMQGGGCLGVEDGMILTAKDETWDLSSIGNPDYEETTVIGIHSRAPDNAENQGNRLSNWIDKVVTPLFEQAAEVTKEVFHPSNSPLHTCSEGKEIKMPGYTVKK